MRFLLVLFFLFPLMADNSVEEIIVEDEEDKRCAPFTQSSAPSYAAAESKEKAAGGSVRAISSAKLKKNAMLITNFIFLPKLSSERPSTQSSPKLGEVMPQLMELVTEALKCLRPLGLLF